MADVRLEMAVRRGENGFEVTLDGRPDPELGRFVDYIHELYRNASWWERLKFRWWAWRQGWKRG